MHTAIYSSLRYVYQYGNAQTARHAEVTIVRKWTYTGSNFSNTYFCGHQNNPDLLFLPWSVNYILNCPPLSLCSLSLTRSHLGTRKAFVYVLHTILHVRDFCVHNYICMCLSWKTTHSKAVIMTTNIQNVISLKTSTPPWVMNQPKMVALFWHSQKDMFAKLPSL